MATETEWSCPICCSHEEEVAYVSPCLHQFCVGCAMRWAWQQPNCPLCRCGITDIVFSVWSEDDYLTFDVPRPAEPLSEDLQDEEGAARPASGAQVDAFPSEVWADFFRSHPNSIRPLTSWLRRELGVLYEDRWWDVGAAEGTIVAHLCHWGLVEGVRERELQNCLPELTGTFIQHLNAAAVCLCGREMRQHLAQQGHHAAGEEEGPFAIQSPSSSRGDTPGPQPASSSSPAGSQPQEEPGQAVAAAPSAQACGRSPSAPGRGKNRSRGGPRRPPKRRAPGPQDSPQPCKRPPRRRH